MPTDYRERLITRALTKYIHEGLVVSIPSGPGSGNVVGPSSSVDNEIPRYDGTTGALLQGSGVFINDAKDLSGIADLSMGGALTGASIADPSNTIDCGTI